MSAAKRHKKQSPPDPENPPGETHPDGYELPDSLQLELKDAISFDQVVGVLGTAISQHIEFDLLELNMLDISTGVFTPFRIYSSRYKEKVVQPLRAGYRLGEGYTGWLVEHRKPLILGDIRKDVQRQKDAGMEEPPLGAYMGLPINANDELIGTIEIAHIETEIYGERDLDAVMKVSDAIAAKLADLRKQSEMQAVHTLAAIQRQLLRKTVHINNLEKLVAELGHVIRGRFMAEWVAFLLFNPDTEALETIRPIVNVQGPQADVDFSIPSPSDSPLASLWKTQDYWIVNQIRSDELIERLELSDDLSNINAQRLLIAPLASDLNRLGIMVVARTQAAEAFVQEDGAILNMVGSICGPLINLASEQALHQAAIKPVEMGRGEDIQSSATYTDALLQITGELATSMDLDHLLTSVLMLLREAVGADQGAFLLTASDSNQLILRASTGSFPAPPPGGRSTPYESDQGLAGWTIQNRISVCIDDLQEDERWIPFDEEEPRQHSALVAPLIVSDEVLGAILLLGHEKNAFSNEDLDLVTAAANQIAPAIHNAQLYHLIQDQAQRLGIALRSQQVEATQSQAVLHAMTDGVIVADSQHRILIFNPAAEIILGLSRQDVLGESASRVFDRLGKVGAVIEDNLQEWQTSGHAASARSLPPQRFKSDQDRVLAIQPAPVVLGDDFLGTITILRDITREVEVDRMKSEFVATVSHELRSPITPIKGFVELLRMGAPGEVTEEQTRYLDIIHQNIYRLELLVDELLDISRIEAGKVVLTFEALNVEQLLNELEAYIAHRVKTEQKQISFQAVMQADLPDIWGDPERIRQILTNLVDNSFDYTPDGGSISVKARSIGDQIEIEVRDNGMGIAVSEQDRIFERFYRGEQALIMGVAGAGLGLSIALNIVEMHGGRIWVNSAGVPGKGSTFTVSLPIASPDSKPGKVVRQR